VLTTLLLAMTMAGWSAPIEVTGEIDGKPGTGKLLVYLPADYSPKRQYPLVIALHGWDHSPELWKTKGDLGPFAEQHAFVLAVPDMGKTIYETAFYPQSKGKWTVAPGTRWVGEVILPYMRKNYAVYSDRAHTSVIGYSTGGRGAVLLAEAYPEFGFAGALSGTYELMTLKPTEGEYKIHAVVYGPRDQFKERWEKDNIVSPARLAKLEGTRLFIAHGGKDRGVNPDQLESLRAALEGSAIHAEFVVVPDAGHDWKFWNSQWSRVFQLADAPVPSKPAPRCPPPGALDAQGNCRPGPCGGIPGGCGPLPDASLRPVEPARKSQ
jgi:enterochelin esterase-like enzyme